MYELHKQVDESFRRFADASGDGKEVKSASNAAADLNTIRKLEKCTREQHEEHDQHEEHERH
jgi:hypothetical protein